MPKTFTRIAPSVGVTAVATVICALVGPAPMEPPMVVPAPLLRVSVLMASGASVAPRYSKPAPVATVTLAAAGSAPAFPAMKVPPVTLTVVLVRLPVTLSVPPVTVVVPV